MNEIVEKDAANIAETDNYSAPGRGAHHTYGVEYRGPHETPNDGTNVAVRLHARALAQSGIPVMLSSLTGYVILDGVARQVHEVGLPAAVEREIGSLRRADISTFAARIIHCVVGSSESLQRLIMPRSLTFADPEQVDQVLSRTILYTVWERDRIDPEIATLLRSVAECWVPCEQNAEMLRAAGVREVVVVPHPYDPNGDMVKLRRRPATLTRRFYSIGAWQPRKAQHELLGAFLLAFTPRSEATLTIKTSPSSWPGYPGPMESIEHWLKDPAVAEHWTRESIDQRVTIIQDRLTEGGIHRLHFQNNIYVAASHGEAWCLPAYDAKIAGNRLIHVPFGGTADFADADDYAIPYTMGPCDPTYKWEPDAQWANFKLEDLTQALRNAKPPVTHKVGVHERFSIDAVGQLMRDRILGLLLFDDTAREYLSEPRQIAVAGYEEEKPKPQPPAVVAVQSRPTIFGAITRLFRR